MRRALLTVLAIGLVALGGMISPRPACACSCVGITTRKAAEQADAVFLGTVIAVDRGWFGGADRAEVRFDVSRVYKGLVYAEQVVTTPVDSAACGLTPEVGTSWVVFARSAVDGEGSQAKLRLSTTLCDGNLSTDDPPRSLGRSSGPLSGASDRGDAAQAVDVRLTRGLVVLGFVGLGAVALIGVGLGFLWRPGRR